MQHVKSVGPFLIVLIQSNYNGVNNDFFNVDEGAVIYGA